MSSPVPASPAPLPLRQPATVLVVDDESRLQETTRRVLDDEFEVLTAGSADEARAILQERAVSVILCDQRMGFARMGTSSRAMDATMHF
ncbi:response regulator [Paraburkholderia sabiae]|uniref:Response regulator n=1 Tax=Paraburkholderia sabiae TaxID=273251 RepID=A0ABU9QR84_9BURK